MKRILFWVIPVLLLTACSDDDSGVAIGEACVLDGDCGPGLYCGDESRCYPIGAYEVCVLDGDCPDGWYCGNRDECVPDGYATDCVYDSDCQSGFFCADSFRLLYPSRSPFERSLRRLATHLRPCPLEWG